MASNSCALLQRHSPVLLSLRACVASAACACIERAVGRQRPTGSAGLTFPHLLLVPRICAIGALAGSARVVKLLRIAGSCNWLRSLMCVVLATCKKWLESKQTMSSALLWCVWCCDNQARALLTSYAPASLTPLSHSADLRRHKPRRTDLQLLVATMAVLTNSEARVHVLHHQ